MPEELVSVDTTIIDSNVALREHKESACCDRCLSPGGEGKTLVCGGCRRVRHESCQGGRKPTSYWYCEDCLPELDAADPASNLELHRFLTTGNAGEGFDGAAAAQEYSFVRGQLLKQEVGREVVVPPPAERYHLLEETHLRLAHCGNPKLYEHMRARYWWPGLHRDCKAIAESCLECSLQRAVFRRKD
jgi:Integrase zinc binding domain